MRNDFNSIDFGRIKVIQSKEGEPYRINEDDKITLSQTDIDSINDYYVKNKDNLGEKTVCIVRNWLRSVRKEMFNSTEECNKYLELLQGIRYYDTRHLDDIGSKLAKTIKSILASSVEGSQYVDKYRFMYELIQNADDCEYPEDIDPEMTITFDIQDNCIILKYNENGFTPQDLYNITGIAESEKNTINVDEVKIGEKGIGFKSVFGIAEAVTIKSTFFAFRLNKENFIVPILLNEIDQKKIEGTEITIKLSEDISCEKIYHEWNERYDKEEGIITSNPIVFLNKLKCIKTICGDNILIFSKEEKKEEIYVDDKEIKFEEIKLIRSKNNKEDETVVPCWKYTKYVEYTDSEVKSRYEDINNVSKYKYPFHIIVVQNKYIRENGRKTGLLYSYFPTLYQTELPLIVHAPFKLNTSREDIVSQSDNPWHKRTCDELESLFSAVYKHLAKMVKEDIVFYLPPLKDNSIFKATMNEKTKEIINFKPYEECIFRNSFKEGEEDDYFTGENIVLFSDISDSGLKEEIYSYICKYKCINQRGLLIPPYENIKNKELKQWIDSQLKECFSDENFISLGDYGQEFFDKVIIEEGNKGLGLLVSVIGNVLNGETDDKECKEKKRKYLESYIINTKNKPLTIDDSKLDIDLFCQGLFYYTHTDNKELPLYNITGETQLDDKYDFYKQDAKKLKDTTDHAKKIYDYLWSDGLSIIKRNMKTVPYLMFSNVFILNSNQKDSFLKFVGNMSKQNAETVVFFKREEKEREARNYKNLCELIKIRNDFNNDDIQKKFVDDLIENMDTETSKTRFFRELIQNADDCEYCDKNPEVTIYYDNKNNEICFSYNENGFLKQDFANITTFYSSDKVNNSTTTGCMGIGSKSVFTIANTEEIHSGNDHLKIEYNSKKGLECSIPDEKSDHFKDTDDNKTHIVLRDLKEEAYDGNTFSTDNIIKQIICLNRIQKITFKEMDPNGNWTEIRSVSKVINESDENRVMLTIKDEKGNKTEEISKYMFDDIKGIYILYQNREVDSYLLKNHLLYVGQPTDVETNSSVIINAPGMKLDNLRKEPKYDSVDFNGYLENIWCTYFKFIQSIEENERRASKKISHLDKFLKCGDESPRALSIFSKKELDIDICEMIREDKEPAKVAIIPTFSEDGDTILVSIKEASSNAYIAPVFVSWIVDKFHGIYNDCLKEYRGVIINNIDEKIIDKLSVILGDNRETDLDDDKKFVSKVLSKGFDVSEKENMEELYKGFIIPCFFGDDITNDITDDTKNYLRTLSIYPIIKSADGKIEYKEISQTDKIYYLKEGSYLPGDKILNKYTILQTPGNEEEKLWKILGIEEFENEDKKVMNDLMEMINKVLDDQCDISELLNFWKIYIDTIRNNAFEDEDQRICLLRKFPSINGNTEDVEKFLYNPDSDWETVVSNDQEIQNNISNYIVDRDYIEIAKYFGCRDLFEFWKSDDCDYKRLLEILLGDEDGIFDSEQKEIVDKLYHSILLNKPEYKEALAQTIYDGFWEIVPNKGDENEDNIKTLNNYYNLYSEYLGEYKKSNPNIQDCRLPKRNDSDIVEFIEEDPMLIGDKYNGTVQELLRDNLIHKDYISLAEYMGCEKLSDYLSDYKSDSSGLRILVDKLKNLEEQEQHEKLDGIDYEIQQWLRNYYYFHYEKDGDEECKFLNYLAYPSVIDSEGEEPIHLKSKSELIIYERIKRFLEKNNESIAYEQSLEITDKDTIKPDFTVKFDGKEYYIEHLGLWNTESDSYKTEFMFKWKQFYSNNRDKLRVTFENDFLVNTQSRRKFEEFLNKGLDERFLQ